MDDPKRPIWKVSRRVLANARALRRNSTDAERLLWSELRDRRLLGFGFRRQVPIGDFIADFACHAAKLVIELDGGQHFSDDAEHRDAARTALIGARGFRVMRFSNHEVMSNRAGVLQSIADVLTASALTPALSRKREREQAADADQPRPEQRRPEQHRPEQSGPEQGGSELTGPELSDLPGCSAPGDSE